MKKDKILKVLLCPWAQAGVVIAILLIAASRLPGAALAVGSTVNNAFYSAVSEEEPDIETSHTPSVEVSDPSLEESSEGYFGDWNEFSDFYEESGTVSVGKPPEPSSESSEEGDSSSEENSGEGEESAPAASDPEASDPETSSEPADESSEPESTPSQPEGSSEEVSDPEGLDGSVPADPDDEPSSESSSEPSSAPSEEPSSVPSGPIAPEID